VLIGVCAQRHGLVSALSRIVVSGRVPDALEARTAATARVFAACWSRRAPARRGRICSAPRRGRTRGRLPERRNAHHQGGATGYRSREWIAHPASREQVQAAAGVCLNPSITGTRSKNHAVTEHGSK
jgi:hypothetical protein